MEASPPPTATSDAACGNVSADPHNCGACGVDCEGGICQDGICSARPAGQLASNQPTPVGIALDDDNVYWMNLGTPSAGGFTGPQLMKCSKAGCGDAPTVLATGTWSGSTPVVVSGGIAYWATQGEILSCPTSGCASKGPTVLWKGTLSPTSVAVDANNVYVGDLSMGALLSCPLAGCSGSPAVVWNGSGSAPQVMVVDNGTLYFGAPGVSVVSCVGSSCTTLLVGGTPSAMAAAGGSIYIGTSEARDAGFGVAVTANGATVDSCPESSCQSGLMTLTGAVSFCQGLAADATNVYFSDLGVSMEADEAGTVFSGMGRVSKCPLTGCGNEPTPIAGYVNSPQQVAVDDANVYWTDFGSDPTQSIGRVMVLPK